MRAPVTDLPVVLDRVSVRAGAMTIIDRLSLTLASGAPTVVVGPNGAGKSTLLRLCMGLSVQTEGAITWGGRADVKPTRRAFVFQRPVMLRRTAAANIAYGLTHADYPHEKIAARTAELLERVGLAELGMRPAVVCPAANSSGSPWRGRWRGTRNCFCSTSQPPVSIRRPRAASRK